MMKVSRYKCLVCLGFISLASAQNIGAPYNASTLVSVGPGGTAILGFVVSPGASTTNYLIRVVGPSLAPFGVSQPCSAVAFTVFDGQGDSALKFEYGTTVPGGLDFPAIFSSVGAFALAAESGDAYQLYALPPGAYSVQAVDASGKGGALLIEIYYNAPPIPAITQPF